MKLNREQTSTNRYVICVVRATTHFIWQVKTNQDKPGSHPHNSAVITCECNIIVMFVHILNIVAATYHPPWPIIQLSAMAALPGFPNLALLFISIKQPIHCASKSIMPNWHIFLSLMHLNWTLLKMEVHHQHQFLSPASLSQGDYRDQDCSSIELDQ